MPVNLSLQILMQLPTEHKMPRVIPTLQISEIESLNEMELAFVLMKRLLKVSHAILFPIPKAITWVLITLLHNGFSPLMQYIQDVLSYRDHDDDCKLDGIVDTTMVFFSGLNSIKSLESAQWHFWRSANIYFVPLCIKYNILIDT